MESERKDKAKQARNLERASRGAPLVRRWRWDELPGLLSKTLEVLPGQTALCRDAQRTWRRLGPGRHRIVGLWGTLTGAQGECYVAQDGPWVLHPSVSVLPTAERAPVEADFLVAVEVRDLAALLGLMNPHREGLTEAELSAVVSEECNQHLPGLTKSYQEGDLCHTPEVARRMEQELRSFLGGALGTWGLTVRSVSHLAFVPTRVALERAERLRALEDHLVYLEQQSALTEGERQQELQEFLTQKEQEATLRALEWESELQEARAMLLGEEVSEEQALVAVMAPEAGLARPGVLKDWLRQRRGELEMAVAARLDRLLQREEGEEEAAAADPAQDLQRAVTLLRWAGAIFVSTTALLLTFAPWLFSDPDVPRRLTAAVGFSVTLIALVASVWLRGKVHKRRREASEEAGVLKRLGLKDRREVDRVVRGEVGAALAQAGENVETARRVAFRAKGGKELAVQFHTLSGEVERVREEVLATPAGGVPWLDEERLPADQLLEMLAFDEGVLRRAAEAAGLSEDLAAAATSQVLDQAGVLGGELAENLLHLRNRFRERGRLVRRE